VTTYLFVLASFIAGFVACRIRTTSRSNHGEALVSRALRTHFSSSDYHLFNHVTIQLQDGTTEIDHILVSRFGIFVIETKAYKGWIFANANHQEWTQVLFRNKFRFQNPIHQNMRHLRAIQALLDFLPSEVISPCVVFVGSAEFKTDMPEGVFTLISLIEHLQDQTQELMSTNRMHFCVGRIEAMRMAISGKTDVEHIQSLVSRHGRSRN
jgi:hypothetical protein